MGLDACVYCDCVEKGKLKKLPAHPELLYIDEGGSPETRSDDLKIQMKFDQWRETACLHEDCHLVLHHLGNISGISWMREVVSSVSENPEKAFPILWSQVIYSGTHCCDFLTPEEAVQLGGEVQRLRHCDLTHYATENGVYLELFLTNLEELVEASRLVGKPIQF